MIFALMKLHLLLASLLVGASAIAQNAPAVFPMPSPFPAVPPGVNSATYPAPRLDWLQRVALNNDRAHKAADSIQLIFDGDSITDFWQSRGKDVWTQFYGKLNAFDFGISGDRTEHLLWRLSQGQVDGIHPKLIALMIGTNNTGTNTPEQIADGVKEVIAGYQKHCPDAVILLQAIFPRAEKPTDPSRLKVKATNEIISKFADGKKVIYTDFGDKFLNADGTMSKETMGDFLHPSLKGYQIWAEAIQPIVEKYFPAK